MTLSNMALAFTPLPGLVEHGVSCEYPLATDPGISPVSASDRPYPLSAVDIKGGVRGAWEEAALRQ